MGCQVRIPVAWHKCEFGFLVRRIGAWVCVGSEQVTVSIPEDKVSDLLERTNDLLSLTKCSKRNLRFFCGSLSLSPALFVLEVPLVRQHCGRRYCSGMLPRVMLRG